MVKVVRRRKRSAATSREDAAPVADRSPGGKLVKPKAKKRRGSTDSSVASDAKLAKVAAALAEEANLASPDVVTKLAGAVLQKRKKRVVKRKKAGGQKAPKRSTELSAVVREAPISSGSEVRVAPTSTASSSSHKQIVAATSQAKASVLPTAPAAPPPPREAALFVAGLTLCSVKNAEAHLQGELLKNPSKQVLDAGLLHCASRGLTSCVKRLLTAKASPDARDDSKPKGRRSALEAAARDGRVDTCRVLVAGGAAKRPEDAAAAAAAVKGLAAYGKLFAKEVAELQQLIPAPPE